MQSGHGQLHVQAIVPQELQTGMGSGQVPNLVEATTGSVDHMATTAKASGRQPDFAAASSTAPCMGSTGKRTSPLPMDGVRWPCTMRASSEQPLTLG